MVILLCGVYVLCKQSSCGTKQDVDGAGSIDGSMSQAGGTLAAGVCVRVLLLSPSRC